MPAPRIAKPQVLTGDTFFNAVSSRAAGTARDLPWSLRALFKLNAGIALARSLAALRRLGMTKEKAALGMTPKERPAEKV